MLKIRPLLTLCVLACACCFLAACRQTRVIDVAALLQIAPGQTCYTGFNFRVNDAENLDCRNMVSDAPVLPYNSSVTLVSATNTTIVFKTVDGVNYTMPYDESALILTPEEFLGRYFLKTPITADGKVYTENGLAKARAGVVEPGMTREEVVLAWGYPAFSRTPNFEGDTWVYYRAEFDTVRVVFKRNKVLQLLTL